MEKESEENIQILKRLSIEDKAKEENIKLSMQSTEKDSVELSNLNYKIE